MEDSVLVLGARPTPTQVIILAARDGGSQPRSGVNVGDPAAVNAAHAAAVGCGLRSVYPLTARRGGCVASSSSDPGGAIVNVLAHLF